MDFRVFVSLILLNGVCCSTPINRRVPTKLGAVPPIESIKFSCWYKTKDGDQFHSASNKNKDEMMSMVQAMAAIDRGLVMVFNDVYVSVSNANDADAKGWYAASGANICNVSYRFKGNPTAAIVKNLALESVAVHAFNFVKDTSFPEIKAVGIGLGVKVADIFCQKMMKSGKMITFLLGVDPVDVSSDLRNVAAYVQMIQTTSTLGARIKQIGHALIVVYHTCTGNTLLAKRMHELIATKKQTMIASKTQQQRNFKIIEGAEHYPAGDNEYLIGFYSDDKKKEGVFYINIGIGQCNLFSAEKKAFAWKEKNSCPFSATFSCLYATKEDGHAFESKSDLQEVKNMFAAMQSESSRGISLFFNDVNVYAPEKNDLMGWYDASETNICYVSYEFVGNQQEMMEKELLECVASQARNVVTIKIGTNFKAVVGDGHGVQVAAYYCRFFELYSGRKISFLLGLNPKDLSTYLTEDSLIRNDDAENVQIIHIKWMPHAYEHLDLASTIVHHNCAKLDDSLVTKRIHQWTAAKQLTMIASKHPNAFGKILPGTQHHELGADEYLLGVYSQNKHTGVSYITVGNEYCDAVATGEINTLISKAKTSSPHQLQAQPKPQPHQFVPTFTCLYGTKNGHAFGSANDATTLKDMANGMGMGSSRGFLLFFNDRNVGAPKENDLMGWFDATDTNICHVSYQLNSNPNQELLQNIASESRKLVIDVREKQMGERAILVVGDGFGLQIAVYFSRSIKSYSNKRVNFLLGLNPIDMTTFLTTDSLIRSDDAVHIQMIYTQWIPPAYQNLRLTSIKLHKCADLDDSLMVKRIYELTGTKQLIIIASESKNATGKVFPATHHPTLGSNERLVGIYSQNNQAGLFHITLNDEYCKVVAGKINAFSAEKINWSHQFPVTFSCWYDIMTGHAFKSVSDPQEIHEMAHTMRVGPNGGLSFFFNDVNIDAPKENDAGKDWHEASGETVCHVSYRFDGPNQLEQMVKQGLFEFLASKARAIAKIVRETHKSSQKKGQTMELQLKAAGTGAGLQAAVYYCRYSKLAFNTKVAFLLGLNPIDMTKFLTTDSLITSDDADNVQLIYTHSIPLVYQNLKINSIVHQVACSELGYPLTAERIHELTAAKLLNTIATRSSDTVSKILPGNHLPTLKTDESLVGIYSQNKHTGVFHLAVNNEYCKVLAEVINTFSREKINWSHQFPVTFSCWYHSKTERGAFRLVSDRKSIEELADAMDMDKSGELSLFFNDVNVGASKENGAGKRWHEASGANICYVSFSGPTRLEDMLKQKLFEFVASKARALAKIVYEKHESSKKTDSKTSKFQLKAVGTGAGVQAAVFYSRHIEFYFNTKVAFLLGLNPILIPADISVRNDDAVYIQMIHHNSIPKVYADSSILYTHKCDSKTDLSVLHLHELIANRNVNVIALKIGHAPTDAGGRILSGDAHFALSPSECEVGIYGNQDPRKGTFYFHVKVEDCHLFAASQSLFGKTLNSLSLW